MTVNGARGQFLARARLAEDADRNVAARHARDEREDLAHDRRVADDAVDGLALGDRYVLVLFDDAAHAVMLGARAEERGQRVARFRSPGVDAVDEEQFAFAADDPIVFACGGDEVELRSGKRGKRSDFLPLPEAVARSETPGRRNEVARGERKFAQCRIAQQAHLDGRGGGLALRECNLHFGGDRFRSRGVAAAEGVAEVL